MLEDIKRNVDEQKRDAENILEKLTAFSTTLKNDITPAVIELDKNVSGINLSAENEKLVNEKKQVEMPLPANWYNCLTRRWLNSEKKDRDSSNKPALGIHLYTIINSEKQFPSWGAAFIIYGRTMPPNTLYFPNK